MGWGGGANRPRRKNRPGAFINSEKVELVEFGTLRTFLSHYLSGYVLEHQVECTSWERTGVHLDHTLTQLRPQYRPTG